MPGEDGMVPSMWGEATVGRDRLQAPEERALAGRIAAALWLGGAAMLLAGLVLPGGPTPRAGLVVLGAAAAAACGAALAAVPWERAPRLLLHGSAAAGLVLMAALQPLTGGGSSPVHEYAWVVVVYAGVFFAASPALACWLAAGAVAGSPLLYDPDAVDANVARGLLVEVPMFALVGALAFAARELLSSLSHASTALERDRSRLVDEQSSLRRVATAVAAGSPPEGVFALVSAEAGRLLGADAAAISRYLDDDRIEVMGVWRGRAEPGQVLGLDAADELARVRAAGAPVIIDRYGADAVSRAHGFGYAAFVAAPVFTGSAVWGALSAGAERPGAFPPGTEERLAAYAEIIAAAVAHAEGRARVERAPGIDPLTGLPDHRVFDRRVAEEVSRAQRHGRPVAVAIADVDGFGELAERVGRDEADRTLVAVAGEVRSAVRAEDVVARLGTHAFGLVLVEAGRGAASSAAERVRARVASARPRPGVGVTVSIGLCDVGSATDAGDIVRRAEAALTWSAAHGGDRCRAYDAALGGEPHGHIAANADRERGLAGLRELARAVDAKDAATREHSERVASFAARLATARGWSGDSVDRLREAALVHDVGKIGVPDDVLLKPARLDAGEAELVRDHAALGARIAGDVLDEAQAGWIAAHHERPDGAGYPQGLHARDIPEGAALLGLAEAWETMVTGRSWAPRRPVGEALMECRGLAGRQFAVEAVQALETLVHGGQIAEAAARMHRPTPVG